jgi:AraC-like DNA-binding protein
VEARLPADVVTRAWDFAAELTLDPCFGLHLVESAKRGTFDLVEYVTRSCGTYGAALEHLARYYRLIEDIAEIVVRVEGEHAVVSYGAVDPAWAPRLRHCAEASMAAWVITGRRALGEAFAPALATFRHPPPPNLETHHRIFRSPLRFGAADNTIRFDRRALEAPITRADEALRRVLERQADALLAGLPAGRDLVARVRHALVALLPGGSQSLRTVARSLGTSTRSLQRDLALAGVTFQGLVSEVRYHLARQYLEGGRISVAEIGFLLGFSEPSAFQRAFRRWSGTTPLMYRRGRLSASTLTTDMPRS